MKGLLTGIRVVVGLLIFGLGVYGAYDQSSRKVATESALADLLAATDRGLPVLTADKVTAAHDGQFVFIQGTIEAPQVSDPLTGLTLPGTWLARTVELEQWDEQLKDENRRPGSTIASNPEYAYRRVWSDRLIDSDDFSMRGDHEGKVNPKQKPHENETFVAETMQLDAWQVRTVGYASWFGIDSVSEETLSTAEIRRTWIARGPHLYDSDNPDLRAGYRVSPMASGFYSLIGIPNHGAIDVPEEFGLAALILPGNASPQEVVIAATGTVPEVQSGWIYYSFVGLLLLLPPLARPFAGLKFYTEAPFFMRFAMTVVAAAAIAGTTSLLMPS
ncbi:MAG: TMEM43 family protein [Magnetospiraceae bacterium]